MEKGEPGGKILNHSYRHPIRLVLCHREFLMSNCWNSHFTGNNQFRAQLCNDITLGSFYIVRNLPGELNPLTTAQNVKVAY